MSFEVENVPDHRRTHGCMTDNTYLTYKANEAEGGRGGGLAAEAGGQATYRELKAHCGESRIAI